jgi:hypothetical protein
MKKQYLIVVSNSSYNDIQYTKVVTLDQKKIHDYINKEYINLEVCHKIDKEDFLSHYKNIGKSLSSTLYKYKYYQEENLYEFYDGEHTKRIELFDITDLTMKESFCLAIEKDIAKTYLISKDVFNKLWNNVNQLLVLYADVEDEEIKTIKDFSNNGKYLDNSTYIPAEYVDYNDFDYDTGDIKHYERIGLVDSLESDIILKVVKHNNIKFL